MENMNTLTFLDQNIDAFEKIQFYMKYNETLTCSDLMTELSVDHFDGYECLLGVLLLSSQDAAIERTAKRFFLQLFNEKLQETGAANMVAYIQKLLHEEQRKFSARRQSLQALHTQDKNINSNSI